MSFAELDAHPDKARLMEIAFTIRQGESDGRANLEVNPEFIRRQKDAQKRLEKAYKAK